MSTIKPLLYKLLERTLKVLETESIVIEEVKIAIKGNLEDRFQSPSIQKIVNMATYSDPGYKELKFLN